MYRRRRGWWRRKKKEEAEEEEEKEEEFLYLVFIRMPRESYRRRLGSLLLYFSATYFER